MDKAYKEFVAELQQAFVDVENDTVKRDRDFTERRRRAEELRLMKERREKQQ